MATSPATAKDKLKDKQNRVEQAMKSAKSQIAESSRAAEIAYSHLQTATRQLASARTELKSSRSAVAKAQVLDAQLKVQLIRAEADLSQARTDVAVAKAKVVEQERQIGELAGQQAQSMSPEMMRLAAIFQARGPQDAVTSMAATMNFADRQVNVFDGLQTAKREVVATRSKVREKRDEVAANKREAAANLKRKRAAQARAQAAKVRMEGLVISHRHARAAALTARKADLKKLRALQRENSRIQELLRRRAAAHHGAGYTGSQNGFLMRPVSGEVTSPFGYRRHPIYGYWGLHDGTDFATGCGAPMRAVADGTVVSRYWQTAYGNRLILDVGNVNGHGIAVIYNHATRYVVGAGAHVQRGQVIGYSGSTGWSTGCHLHFTVMSDGNPVDPMPWF